MIKSNQDIDTKEADADREPPKASDKSIPPDCDPEQYLNWRFRYGYHLARHTEERPIQHTDPWVECAANFMAMLQDGNGSRRPTYVDFVIKDAFAIYSADTLLRQVLEARLLAQQSSEAIAGKCRLDQPTIEAYAAVFFDVRGHRRTQVWFRTDYFSLPPSNSRVWQLGSIVKGSLITQGPEGIEDRIAVLLGLDGNTLADGLPERTNPDFRKTFFIRQEFAGPLLPHSRNTSRLYDRFRQAAAADVAAGHSSDEAVSAGLEILRRAKITVALRKQLKQLRQHCNAGEVEASTAETAGTA